MDPTIAQRLDQIEERNRRVEQDKAWEVSWTRRGTIAIITYSCAVILLWLMHTPRFWAAALVPVVGYILSTLSLGIIKRIWNKQP